ncbi:hypothetical protein IAD21_01800 [Abditibacteriota bacterium]|nr:hypothetical protein IAD21_01800 [Abditibacteriota bacterium]
MKPWIARSSSLCAGLSSFVTLSVVPVVAYGTVALINAWQSGVWGDPASLLAVPVLSGLGAGVFSIAVAPLLSVVAQKWTRRFGWNSAMFPLLLGCASIFALALGNALMGWHWSPSIVMGGGVATGAAFSTYWFPLRWAQTRFARIGAKCEELRGRSERKGRSIPISL